MDIEKTFREYQPLLFSIAYNMLGSVMDAEDCVQEIFIRFAASAKNPEVIRSPRSYLCAMITNLCIDHLRSARVQRESYDGYWLPEPVLTTDPGEHIEMTEVLSVAFLRLLEQLSPLERAVFLLRQVFDYEYGEIARIVGKGEHNCRQIIYRARQHLAAQGPRYRVSLEQHTRLFERFIQAGADGNVEDLLRLLADDVVLFGDGGETRRPMPIAGVEAVASYLQGITERISRETPWHWQLVAINGCPGLVIYAYGRLDAVLAFELRNGLIREIDMIVNPAKLQHLKPDL
jgi:RNA polymerase sigma-70 factor (ECF subfamily)